MIRFDLGLASTLDCLASVSTSLTLPRSHLGLSCRCLVFVFASKILPRSLLCRVKNALTTTLL